MSKISGTVTRVIEKNEATRETPRVFFRPDDPGVLSKFDGSKRTASGEIPVELKADELADYKVGEACEFDVA